MFVVKLFPVTLVLYIVGILAMRAGAPDDAWTTFQLLWVNGGAGMLTALLAGYVMVNGTRAFPRTARTSAIATIMIVAFLGYGQRTEIMLQFSDMMARVAPTAAVATPLGTADVPRHWDGHFRADAVINGTKIDMLVDTGASLVLLTYQDAIDAGVNAAALKFNVPILTANGRSHVATLKINKITIGGVTVHGVDAAVAEHGQLHASLLGMSFLGEIEEAVIRKDRMILRN